MRMRNKNQMRSLNISDDDWEFIKSLSEDSQTYEDDIDESLEFDPLNFPVTKQSRNNKYTNQIKPLIVIGHTVVIRKCLKCRNEFDAELGSKTLLCEKCHDGNRTIELKQEYELEKESENELEKSIDNGIKTESIAKRN